MQSNFTQEVLFRVSRAHLDKVNPQGFAQSALIGISCHSLLPAFHSSKEFDRTIVLDTLVLNSDPPICGVAPI